MIIFVINLALLQCSIVEQIMEEKIKKERLDWLYQSKPDPWSTD